MARWIALLRGVNVGGRNALAMKDLVSLLRASGIKEPRTYIQSGNVVFESEVADIGAMAGDIAAAIETRFAFRPGVFVLAADDLARVIEDNPFPDAAAEPGRLHVFFLAQPPARPDMTMLDALKADGERFVLGERVFYLHAPDGIGRSKLAARVERSLGVEVTARNWRTLLELDKMARDG